jgi:DNA-binding PadR family transcriptional regulator
MPRKTLGNTTVAVLNAIAGGVQYGFDIMDATSLASGTVYPALGRLERQGLVESRWEDHARAAAEKRPPRKYYRITDAGTIALTESARRIAELGRALRPLVDGKGPKGGV